MKHHKHYSGHYFGPPSRLSPRLKAVNGSLRKPRKTARFVSNPMKKILKEVETVQANIKFVIENGRNRKDLGAKNKGYGHGIKICPSRMVINKLRKSNHSEEDQRGRHILSQSKQHLLDGGKVGQRNADAMKEDFTPMAMSPKSRHAFSSEKLVKPALMITTSNMKQGFVHCANAQMSSSQPKNLKAMPGLVLNSKGRRNLDQGPTKWTHKRDHMNGCNDITNDDNLRSRKELLEEKLRSHDDNGNEGGSEGENPAHRSMKRQKKYIETNEDEYGYQSLEGVANDSIRLTSQDDILKDCHDRVSTPYVANCPKKQCNCCSKPIDEPVWRGLLKMSNMEYTPLSGHLSTKSCEKVCNLSKSLSRVVEVTKLPRSKVWPKRWEGSRLTEDNIGLYFFPNKMRRDKCLDQLLKEVMENDLALRAIMGDAEMLIFPSSLLPKRYQMFRMKHYLWGVFKPKAPGPELPVSEGESIKPKEIEGKQGVAVQSDRSTGATDAAILPPVATGVATDAASIPTEYATNAPTVPANHGQSEPSSMGAPPDATNALTVPANHGQSESSSMGAPPGRMLAFVVRQTPRLEQLIREMQQEGVLVMQGEMMSTGSWLANMATTTTQPAAQPSKT